MKAMSEDLLGYRLFARAVAGRSFSAAARGSGVDVSTVTRTIAKLEKALGAKLFLRSTQGLTLTEAGRAYATHVEHVLAEDARIRAAINETRSAKSGTLRVTLPVFVAQHVLPEVTSAFLAAHPAARLDVHASDDNVDLLSAAFDLAIRLGPLPSSSLHARRLVGFERWTCASPSWLRTHGTPSRPEALAGLPCIVYGNGPAPARWAFSGPDGEQVSVTVTARVRSNNLDLLVSLAEQALGLTRLPSWAVRPAIATGRLVPVLPEWTATRSGEDLALHALYPDDPGRRHLRDAFLRCLIEVASRGAP